MLRVFIHIHNGNGFTPDEEGMEVADLAGARAKAEEGIRSIISEEARHGLLDLRGRAELTDETGQVLLVIPFRDVFELHEEGGSAS